ncbi:MAG: ECF RNA polymerase sigma factor SigW [Fimbriimonadaceae bacterium]|nr:ECF RNA polymerase sigma factor SigW [Fimbriimonadaceae bacterium]
MAYVSGVTHLSANQRLDPITEEALIEACRRQNMEAFGRVVDAYQNRVYGFVKRMVRDAEDATDLTQDVFIRAYQGFTRFDGRSSLRTWLFRIAYNLCIDRVRKRDRQPEEFAIEATVEDGEPLQLPDQRWDPERVALDDELRAIIERGIATMSEKLRAVLLLHDREELQYDEIASLLEIPVGTVKSRLFLARNHLKDHLREYWRTEVANK